MAGIVLGGPFVIADDFCSGSPTRSPLLRLGRVWFLDFCVFFFACHPFSKIVFQILFLLHLEQCLDCRASYPVPDFPTAVSSMVLLVSFPVTESLTMCYYTPPRLYPSLSNLRDVRGGEDPLSLLRATVRWTFLSILMSVSDPSALLFGASDQGVGGDYGYLRVLHALSRSSPRGAFFLPTSCTPRPRPMFSGGWVDSCRRLTLLTRTTRGCMSTAPLRSSMD